MSEIIFKVCNISHFSEDLHIEAYKNKESVRKKRLGTYLLEPSSQNKSSHGIESQGHHRGTRLIVIESKDEDSGM